MNIATLINELNAKGIKLWQKDGELKFKAPKDIWTNEIREEITANKGEIIAFLRQISKTNKIPPILPANRTDEDGNAIQTFPLSFVQERLWFLDQLESSVGYNITKAVTICGDADSRPLDINHLEQALNLIIARHENLRTIFPMQESQVRQCILDSLDFKLERIDLSHYKSNETLHKKAQELCQNEAAKPFDLAKGPLIRGKLIKLTGQEHILILTMHHIITDAWSMGVFVKEFGLIMDWLGQGKSPDLPSLPIQYLDYGVWQRKLLEEDGLLEQQLAYWQEKLAGVPESLNLITDYPRPSVRSFAGARQDFRLDAQLTSQLNNLAKQQGCTLFMALLAALKTLLYRYTGQEDICLGSPIANRQYEGTENLIGMFVNTIALRSLVEGEASFNTLLTQVKTTCLEAYKHQDTPFDKIVDLVQPQRSLAIDPIFQIMIVLQNTPREVPEQFIQPYPLKGEISKFDINFEFTETLEGLEGSIEYRTSLYSPQTIERMAQHFIRLCQAIISTPTVKISELEFIGDAEKQQLLIDHNKTQVDYPKDKCIHQLFIEQVAINPDKVAVVYQDEALSYQQLYDKSHDLALYLQSLGVQPDSLVGLCVERSLEMIVGILGILQAGGAYVPLDPDYPDARLAYMVEDSQASVILTQKKLQDRLRDLTTKDTQLITLDQQWPEICDCAADLTAKQVKLKQEVKSNHLAYMIYTSGSTGNPKGVMVEHRSLVNHNTYAGAKYQITKNDRQFLFSSMNFDLFIEELFVILNNGAQLLIEQKDNLLTLQYFKNLIKVHNITVLNIPTAFFHQLVVSDIPLDSIKNVIIGGEQLEYSKAQTFTNKYSNINLYNTYGPTETTIISTVSCVTNGLISQHNAAPIGHPISNTQVYILDQHNNPVPTGVPGELHIAGDGLARGYLNRPELTEEKFIPNPFNPGTRMYKSGDLARWLGDGNIEYLGRIDTQVKIRGFRIELGEIEARLNQYPEIKDSVVIAQGQEGNKSLIAFYVAKGSKDEQIIKLVHEDLRAYLQQNLPDYMLPVAFASLKVIPLTPNGKVDRRVLERMEVSLESSQAYLAPRNATEKQLVAIWAEVLDLEPEEIGVNDNFFELGGDSIKTIQIVSKAIENHIHFDIRDMFNYQNIHELLQYCDTTKVRVILKEEGILQGVVDLSPIQSYFFESVKTDNHHFNQSVLLNLNVRLSIEVLQELITPLLEQHDALRFRFTKDDNGWQQHYLGSVANTPEMLGIHSYDITELDEKQVSDYIQQTCNHWQARLDLEKGPIMRWVYFDSKGNGCDQLAIIVHHLVIDGVSWRILLEDLNQLIGQQLAKQQLQLSQKRSSYRNWVDSLAAYKESKQGQKDLAFWVEQSKKLQHTSNAFVAKAYQSQDIQHTNVLLSKPNTGKLLKHCHQAYGTDINDLLLTALMLSYYQVTGNNNLMLDVEGHGREQIDPAIDITKTLGWFTSIYPVSFELSNPEDIGQSIKEVKTALHEIPNKGVGFSIFRYINQHEAIKEIPEAQVVFNFLGDFQSNERESANNYFTFSENSSGDASSQRKEVDKLVTINGLVVFGQLSFTFSYPEEWQGQKISRWQTHFISALEELIEHCDDSPRMGYTPSDFPLLPASLTQLGKITLDLKEHQDTQLDNIQDIYPLTPLQSGILFETLHAQTDENKGMYLTQSAIGINGQVDISMVQQAWQLILNHYDALRMHVITANAANINMDLQVILKQVEIKINRVDWSEKTHTELKPACEQWMHESKRSGISLDQAPLMRISLFQGQESCYMLFEQHHIVMDGWSQSIVLANLFKLYQALMQQQDYQLPPAAPYSSYVRALLNRNHEEETLYWQEYLAHYEERTPLPMNHLSPQQNIARDVFNTSTFCLSQEHSIELEQLIKKHRLTMNTVLQFLWGLFLHLHSGNKTITFGSVNSGRTGILDIKHNDQMVGLCINTTPTCIRFDADLSLLDQLKQMQSRESEKLNYELTSLIHIQEILGINTNEDFYQTNFVYENYPVEQISEADSLINDFIGNEAPNYPLSFKGWSQETLSISFDYDGYYYNEETIITLMEQFKRLTLQLIAAPEVTIKEVSLISAHEKQLLLADFNNTQVEYPKDKCIHQLFIEQVAINPDKVAVVYQDETLSYQQLYDKSHALALYLQSLGVEPDSLVGLCVERSSEMMVGILGILLAGGAYLPLDPAYPDDRLAYMLQDSQTAIVLTKEKLKDQLNSLVEKNTTLITFDQLEGQLQWPEIVDHVSQLKGKRVKLTSEVKPHHLAYVIYTSGSTGKSKGVAIEHRSVINMVLSQVQDLSIVKEDTLLQNFSISFDGAVYEMYLALLSGASLVISSKEEQSDPIKFLNCLVKKTVSVATITPSFLTAIGKQLLPLRLLISAGESANKDILQFHLENKIDCINAYGPTEASVCVSYYKLNLVNNHINSIPIGSPINNTQIFVLDQYSNPAPIGVPGELHIAGDGLARGYLNRPELTEEKFIPNPFNPGTRMYKSGDLARWLEDGNIECLGRIDTQVKIRGFRIELGEIEAQLNQYPGIKESIVITQEREGSKTLVAHYVAKGSNESQSVNLAHEDIRAYLQQTLPEHMLPSLFVGLEAIPLTPNGKVDHRALERIDVSVESSQAYLAPRNATETQLVAIWAGVLNLELEKIGVNDNFFELGGDSIKTIQIVSKAIEHHIYFDTRDMLKHQNIHDLLQHCDTTKSNEILKEEDTLRGPVDLSPIQSYFFGHVQTDVHHFNQSVLLNMNVRLSIEVLQELIIPLLKQHDALRLRYTKDGNDWQQRYVGSVADTPDALGIHSYDIAALDEKEIPEYIEQTCNHWQTRLDLEKGPIMRWVYFDSKGNGCDQLAIIVHHLVIDGVSWRILFEDLNHLIGQQLTQQELQLSQKRSSYRNWVDSLAAYKESKQGQKDLAFWIEQSDKAQHTSNAFVAKVYRNQDIHHTNVLLSKPNTEKLLKHCHQAYGTDINDLLLTALMLSYYQATGNNNLMLDLEGHGREQIDPAIDITKTLGWFTSFYPVSFELSNPEDIGQSIKEVKTALHKIPNKGVGFSIFRHINQHEAIKEIPEAQVIFNFLGDFKLNERELAENYFTFSENSTGYSSSRQKEVNRLVAINGLVVFDQLSFTFSYPEEWQGQKVSHWQTHFISALEELIEHCDDSPRMGYTPSDFPLLPASLAQLGKITLDLKEHQDIKLDNIQDIYPLTPLQSGILFETLYAQTEENKGMYLTQTAVGVQGQADLKVMQRAWQMILNHYDALRMLVIPADSASIGLDLQVILKQVEIKINEVDWSEKSHPELRSACEQEMRESKSSGIDLYKAPLIRISLFQGQESCYMLFEQHHIVMDGWSQSIVLASLFKIYQALVRQQDYQLPPSAPHKAYVQALLNRNQKEETAYWQEYLAHYEERTPLPMSHQSALQNISKDGFYTSTFSLSDENAIQLEQLIKKHRLTMNTVLQFIWGLLLHLHSSNKTITFGSVSSGRTGLIDIEHSDQMVGLCINTTPTCIQFDADLSLMDHLKLMQNRESEKLNYEAIPLIRVQELLGIKTNEDFFQTLFVYENYPVEQVSESNSLIKDFIGNEAPNYPLSIAGVSNEKVSISFTYDGFYYDDETINSLMKQFERLTLQLVSAPEATIKEVSLISAHEKHQLLVEYNQTQADYPSDKCIHQLFIEQVAINPDKVAVVYQDETLSYQQLYEKSHALALYLQSLGVKPDSLVGLCVESSLEMLVGILGILQAGGAYVPLDPDYPEDRLAYILQDSRAGIVLTQGHLKDKLNDVMGGSGQLIALDAQWQHISAATATMQSEGIDLSVQVNSHNVAYVIYTSGSTGQPKGAVNIHRGFVNLTHWYTRDLNMVAEDRIVIISNTSFDLTQKNFLGPLLVGASIHLIKNYDPSLIKRLIKEQSISWINCAPSSFYGLLEDGPDGLDSLKTVVLGGESIQTKKLHEWFGQYKGKVKLYNSYGPSECSDVVSVYACTELQDNYPIGRPVNNVQLYILDEYQQPQPPGVPGELYIGGVGVGQGYLHRPQLTQEKFIPNPFSSGSLMYQSGDLARWLDDGNIEYLGRIDTQVKVRGFRIELGEIEARLNQYPEVKDSVVIAQGQEGNKRLIAYYVASNSTEDQIIDLDNEGLRIHLLQTLPDYMLPVAIVSLGAIPLTPNGKVDRRALELMDVSIESSKAYQAPRNEMEKQMVAIWAEVLKLDPEKIGVNDNFFELGGHSLLATQVVSKIRSQLGIEVPLKALFNTNTLAAVAEVTQAIKVQHAKLPLDVDLNEVEFEETSL
ncbi:MAG: amino acid adenylation domain-containing protein [Arenicella sp.]|jgi:amino acid adenylation domain-containing protein/non-ribosomal peptide synthase protein (TIGR01720 family)